MGVSHIDISRKNFSVRKKNPTVENVLDMCEEQQRNSAAGAK